MISILLSLLLGTLTACADAPTDVPPAVVQPTAPHCVGAPRLVTFGDSFTANEPGYVVALAQHLGMKLDNQALGGSQLSDPAQAERMKAFAFCQEDVALAMIGFNDPFWNKGNDEYPARFQAILQTVVDTLGPEGMHVYIAGPSYMSAEGYAKYGTTSEATEQYARAVRNVLTRSTFTTVHFIDITNLYGHPPDSLVSDDHVHPSPAGFMVLENLFYQGIKS